MTHRAQLVWAHLTRITANQPIVGARRLISGLVGALSLVRRQAAYPVAREDLANSSRPRPVLTPKTVLIATSLYAIIFPMTSPANQTMQMLEAIIARQPRHNSTINTHSIQCVPSAAGEPFANPKISPKKFLAKKLRQRWKTAHHQPVSPGGGWVRGCDDRHENHRDRGPQCRLGAEL